jgi:MFS family permease
MSEIVELQETISPRPENIPDETPNTDEDANNDANSEEEESHDYPQGIRLLLITLALVLSVFLSALDSTIVATAIPTITNQFGHLDDVTWYSSAYSLTNFAFLSSWGKAYRHFSLKATFLLAGVIFEVGNVICALSKDSTTLIAGRAISGLGGGGIMSGAFIIIALTVRPSRRAAYMGIIGVTFGCAGVVGPVLGGVLTERVSWRWCFWLVPYGPWERMTLEY